MKNLVITGFALLVFASTALAFDLPVETLATKVVQLSGIERSLTSLPETLRAQSDLMAVTRLPDEKQSAEDAALSAFDPEAAKKRLIQYIAANCDVESLSKTLLWLESPVGLKMTAAEGAEKGLELQAGMLQYLAEIKKTPPNPDRIVAIRKLVQVSGQLEMVEKIFEATAIRVASAVAGGASGPEVDSFIHTKVREAWIPLEKQFQQQLVAADLYIYRGVSDDELSSYNTFLESEAGKHYSRAIIGGYGQILEDLVIESKKELIEAMKKQALVRDEDDDACVEDGDVAVSDPAAVK